MKSILNFQNGQKKCPKFYCKNTLTEKIFRHDVEKISSQFTL